MGIIVRLITVLVGLLFIFMVLSIMKAKRLTEAQSVGWLTGGFVLVVLGVFPELLSLAANLLGVWYAPTMVAILAIVLLLFIVFFHTTELSKLTNQINELAMQTTLLMDKNKELQKKIEEIEREE